MRLTTNYNLLFKFSLLIFFHIFSSGYLNAYELYKKGCLEEKSESYKTGAQYAYPYTYLIQFKEKKGKEQYCDFLFDFVSLKQNNIEKLDFNKIACTNGLQIDLLGEKISDIFLTKKVEVNFPNRGGYFTATAINNTVPATDFKCFVKGEQSSNVVKYSYDASPKRTFEIKYTMIKIISSN